MIFGVWNPEKIWHQQLIQGASGTVNYSLQFFWPTLYICPPYLYTVWWFCSGWWIIHSSRPLT